MQEDKKAQWEQLAREVLSGMKEWQSQHPKATFAEIEEAIEEQVAKMRARMLEEVVQWRAVEAGEERPQMRCNACGASSSTGASMCGTSPPKAISKSP